ncbi:hypothetical protein C8R45DRAFT_1099104 [Mycena sanguinolenta]|nr:hypothetical protein C8R45DRAFT_1099104 [Mycena sanguinolenta]
MAYCLTAGHAPVTSSGSKFIEMFSDSELGVSTPLPVAQAVSPPLTKDEARTTLDQSQLLLEAVPSPILRSARRENTLYPIHETAIASAPTSTPPAPCAPRRTASPLRRWWPLANTRSTAHALIRSKLFAPREINLAWKIGHEKTLHTVPVPTPDQR